MDKSKRLSPDLSAEEAASGTPPVSRRSILRTAISVTAGAAAATLAAAAPAVAATGDPVKAGEQTLTEGITEVKYDGSGPLNGVVLIANDSTWLPTTTQFKSALAGWAGGGTTAGAGGVKTGIYGFTDAGDGQGVIGVARSHDAATGGAGVCGWAWSAGVVGVRAISTTGVALRVEGPASFSRSGRASVPKNRAYVDITVPGGLDAAANILATIQMYRSGVWVTGVRRNYPTAGKARIYLNKVASTVAATPVAWFVVG